MKQPPYMIHTMEILQLPLVKLNQRIECELSDNEALERSSAQAPAQSETPELVVECDGNDNCVVNLRDEFIPCLRVKDDHLRLLQSLQNGETKEEVSAKIESARWLMEAIDSRYKMLKSVAQTIVNHQRQFFKKESRQLRPLTIAKVAGVLDLHPTTVSRAIDNKWVETSQGTSLLRSFLSGRMTGEGLTMKDGG